MYGVKVDQSVSPSSLSRESTIARVSQLRSTSSVYSIQCNKHVVSRLYFSGMSMLITTPRFKFCADVSNLGQVYHSLCGPVYSTV